MSVVDGKIDWSPACRRCDYSVQRSKYPTAPHLFCRFHSGRVSKDNWCDDFKKKVVVDERRQ